MTQGATCPLEGVVKVWVVGEEPKAVSVSAGSALFMADDAQARPELATAAPIIERKLAWRGGRLDLSEETLAEAAEEFNRYSPTPIVINERAIGNKRLYGIFRLDDPEGFAKRAAVTLGASVSHENEKIVIRATPAGGGRTRQ